MHSVGVTEVIHKLLMENFLKEFLLNLMSHGLGD